MGAVWVKALTDGVGTIDDLWAALDKQFLPATADQDEDEWDNMAIGTKTVAVFYTDVTTMGKRMDKSASEIKRAFVKGFEVDYPELWMQLRTTLRSLSVDDMRARASEWIELARRGNTTSKAGSRRSAAAVARGGEQDDEGADWGRVAAAAVQEQTLPLTQKIADLEANISKMYSTVVHALPNAAQARPPQDVREGWRAPPPPPQRPAAQPWQPQTPTASQAHKWGTTGDLSGAQGRQHPAGWVKGTVTRANPEKGYAAVTPAGADQSVRAHVLQSSAPYELRVQMQLGETCDYIAERDDKGWRVVQIRCPAAEQRARAQAQGKPTGQA